MNHDFVNITYYSFGIKFVEKHIMTCLGLHTQGLRPGTWPGTCKSWFGSWLGTWDLLMTCKTMT